MTKCFSRHLLYRIRNEIPLASLLVVLEWPHKPRDGRVCLLCPQCGELLAPINPRTNLARCFPCETNFNTIDLTMLVRGDDFVNAVHFLESLLPSPNAG